MFKEYVEHDATGLADLISRRQVTPGEVLEAAIACAEAVNPRLNAIVWPLNWNRPSLGHSDGHRGS